MTTEAYPLYWPENRPRTEQYRRENARFATSFARARNEVIHQIDLLLGRYRVHQANIVVSTNVTLRRDGLPLANQRIPDDVGVAVYFTYKKRQMCFACDRWRKIEDNMQAIAKTIEALRGVARWGTGDMMEAAFQGFTALPSPNSVRTWREVLGLASGPQSMEQVIGLGFEELGITYTVGGGKGSEARELLIWNDHCETRRRETGTLRLFE